MRVLYVSPRLNSPDGSSVHGRAFVASVEKLGHDIQTYPKILPSSDIGKVRAVVKKNALFYLKKLRPKSILGRIRGLDFRISLAFDLLGGIKTSIKDCFRIRRLIKTFKPDVIVYRQYLFDFSAIWAAQTMKIPSVIEVNALKSVEFDSNKSNKMSRYITSWAETYSITRTDQVFCVSSAIKKMLDEIVDSNLVSVVPNGVDADVFNRDAYAPEKLKAELNITGKIILGYAGSYMPWHDVPLTIKIIAALKQINPNFHLLLIGRGDSYRRVEEEIKSCGLTSFVTQINQVPHAEMPKYLSIMDIALMTYPIMEGFYFSPLKMYEYMAVGMPIVSTDIGQIGEVIEQNETGILIAQPTADNFVRAILQIVDDKGQLEKMSDTSRRLAIERHSWLNNARDVMGICEGIIVSK